MFKINFKKIKDIIFKGVKYLNMVISNFMRRLFAFILFFVFLGLIIICVKFLDYNSTMLFFDYLKILVWPVIILIFISLFKENIAKFIDETEWMNFGKNKIKRKLLTQDVIKSKDEIDILEEYKGLKTEYKGMINAMGNDIESLKKELTNKKIEIEFERIFRVIFGSQLSLLDSLLHMRKINFFRIQEYFQMVQKNNYPLRVWNLNEYLDFLIKNQLIVPDNGDGYKITIKGEAFMFYIKDIQKYNINKPL